MRIKQIAPIALALCLLGGGAAHAQRRVRLRTTADSLSYYTAIYMAAMYKPTFDNLPLEFSLRAFQAGTEAALAPRRAGGSTEEEAMAYIADYFGVRLPAENLRAAERWLTEVEQQTPNIVRTESGLLYRIVKTGARRAKRDDDRVEVRYEGLLRDGSIFDSSDRHTPNVFALNRVILGFAEGLKLVGEGGTIELWIPPALAYGEGGNNSVPPNTALYFKIDVIEINPAESETDIE